MPSLHTECRLHCSMGCLWAIRVLSSLLSASEKVSRHGPTAPFAHATELEHFTTSGISLPSYLFLFWEGKGGAVALAWSMSFSLRCFASLPPVCLTLVLVLVLLTGTLQPRASEGGWGKIESCMPEICRITLCSSLSEPGIAACAAILASLSGIEPASASKP
jgi:hypothetical protein